MTLKYVYGGMDSLDEAEPKLEASDNNPEVLNFRLVSNT